MQHFGYSIKLTIKYLTYTNKQSIILRHETIALHNCLLHIIYEWAGTVPAKYWF